MNFRLHDTRGLEADQGIDGHEINFIVDGNLPDRHQVILSIFSFENKTFFTCTLKK